MKIEVLKEILSELKILKNEISNFDVDVNTRNYKSALNLKAYVSLRSKDITKLQDMLSSHGLSSFGRSQSCIVNSINQDIILLSRLLDKDFCETTLDNQHIKFDEAKEIMYQNSKVFGGHQELFYNNSNHIFSTRVMITLPSEAKDSPSLISDLIGGGANILRINTAHDDAAAWQQMALYIKQENEKQNKQTKIYVDLAGPKNRTGTIKKELISFKIGSWRNPQIIQIASKENIAIQTSNDLYTNPVLVVDEKIYKKAAKNKAIEIFDFEREKYIEYPLLKEDNKIFAIANKKVIVVENTTIKVNNTVSKLYNFELKPIEIRVFRGDEIILTHNDVDGMNDYEYKNKRYSALIGCTNLQIFEHIKIGDEIFIDDGKIGCKVISENKLGVVCQVFLANEKGSVLKEEKGINFPSTNLDIAAITKTDEENFESICNFADIIGISFAQSDKDIKKLKEMLSSKGLFDVAIAPKIETKIALKNLPTILEELISWNKFALMIARGDLAIEVGFDNLPYIQEEIFGICESAHVPVIYATQILEGKMKNNLPSRSEVTDAAFAQRADCVMLNKGAFVLQTVETLQQILQSMHTIFQKNRQLLSRCEMWD